MRLLFIRHGDPDYEHDSLTEKGFREAQLLADRLEKERLDHIFLSPQGRAQRTAEPTLARLGRTGETFSWLHEFTHLVRLPETGEDHLVWDLLPAFLDAHPRLREADNWLNEPFISQSAVPEKYREACEGLDKLLAAHGYERCGSYYRAVRPNRDTLAFFCHFGTTGILLSHLFGLSPIPLLQYFAAAPTSVTVVYTEERERGIASFRAACYGDVSHLYAAGESPSFSARFCETFDSDERH